VRSTTLAGNNKDPLDVRIKKMVDVYHVDFDISKEMLSGYIGKNVEAFTEQDIVRLTKVYRSLKDGIIGSEYFTDKMKGAIAETSAKSKEAERAEQPADAEQVNIDDL
jgi:hypothetical protein